MSTITHITQISEIQPLLELRQELNFQSFHRSLLDSRLFDPEILGVLSENDPDVIGLLLDQVIRPAILQRSDARLPIFEQQAETLLSEMISDTDTFITESESITDEWRIFNGKREKLLNLIFELKEKAAERARNSQSAIDQEFNQVMDQAVIVIEQQDVYSAESLKIIEALTALFIETRKGSLAVQAGAEKVGERDKQVQQVTKNQIERLKDILS